MPAQPTAASLTKPSPAATGTPEVQARTFFDALLGDVPDGMHGTLWTRDDKRSLWVPTVDGDGAARATNAALRLVKADREVYWGVSVARKPGRVDQRISNDDAAGIYGLWIDLDVATPDVHKKWNLPPTIEACHEVLDAVGLPPTMIVHSGHGLHAWWLFTEFWQFDTEDDRLAAAGLVQRWNTTVQARAAERSWTVDSTFDLSRVLRVPGSVNRKSDPVPVVLEKYDPTLRYDRDDFETYCVDASYLAARGLSPARTYVVGELQLSDSMSVDFEAMEALKDNTDLFTPTWEKKRRELNDDPSAYDLSLASQAARAGWTDQEIAALILAFRRKHKLDTAKALRLDYVARTISRARESIDRTETASIIEEVGDALADAKATGDDEVIRPARRAALDVIGSQLGLEVLHVIKYLSDPAQFALVTPTAAILLGDREGVLRWDKFRGSVWEAVGHQIPRFPQAAWDRLTELIPRAWEEQDVGAEATERGELSAWLTSYLAMRVPVDKVDEAAENEYPFVEPTGRVCLFGVGFKRWLHLSESVRITNREMGRRLRDFGCEPDKVNVRDEHTGKRTSRATWRLPTGIGNPPDEPAGDVLLSVAS